MPTHVPRNLRKLREYASHDGKTLTGKRPLTDVSPTFKQSKRMRKESGSATEATAASSASVSGIDQSVLDYLKATCPQASVRYAPAHLRLVDAIARISASHQQNDEDKKVHVTRLNASVTTRNLKKAHGTAEAERQTDVMDALCLAALQRHAQQQNNQNSSEPSSILVFVPNVSVAEELAGRAQNTFHIRETVLLAAASSNGQDLQKQNEKGGKKKQKNKNSTPASSGATFRSMYAKGSDESSESAGGVTLFIATLEGFLQAAVSSVSGGESSWSLSRVCAQVGCMVLLRVAMRLCGTGNHYDPTAPIASELAPLQRAIGTRLGNVKNVVVLDDTLELLSAPQLRVFTSALSSAAEAPSSTPDASTAASTSSSSSSSSLNKSTARAATKIHYAVVEGTARFNLLLALIYGMQSGQGLVVNFATKEACKFAYDVLYALEEVPSDVRLLCDYIGPSEYSDIRDDADRAKLVQEFDEILQETNGASAVNEEETHEKKKKTREETKVVLLTAFGLVPTRGTTFLQYDIATDIVNFTQFVADKLTPGAVLNNSGSATTETETGKKGKNSGKNQHEKEKEHISGASLAMYKHVIVLFHTNEHSEGRRFLRAPAARLAISVLPLPQLPSATRHLLAIQQLQSLNRKIFAIQNSAYEAYRATMLIYSYLQPKSVYNVSDLNLTNVASQFGYEEAPLLDLRTKDTPFRPKVDFVKAAKQRLKSDRRHLRAYANENIIGKESEDHMDENWASN